MNPQKIGRQAVIVIHGMGEQRPMETLRSFVNGIKSQLNHQVPGEMDAKVRSKPDSVGDIYETTRLSLEGHYDKVNKKFRPKTDFYEFYWAHNMRNTNFSEMWTWIKQVVFKPVTKIPEQLRPVWWTIWSLVVFVATVSLVVKIGFHIKIWKVVGTAILASSLVTLIYNTLTGLLKSAVLRSLGDVTRYMTPEPDNISERSNIRQQGIKFLKKLHTIDKETKPDRIIVVAHSLGSVIGYDLLRLLWTEYNAVYADVPLAKRPYLQVVNDLAVAGGKFEGNKIDAYQKAQNDCWQECRGLGNPWLITDFITVGAALNAIDYFMVTDTDIDILISEREIPVSPPVLDDGYNIIFYDPPVATADNKNKQQPLHHGAMFGVTRWTNIFFSTDYVGGPMHRKLGFGAKDIKVQRAGVWFYPGGHTDYWTWHGLDKTGKEKNQGLKELTDALKLY